jgi:hypothetical protein
MEREAQPSFAGAMPKARSLWIGALLVAATLAAYLPALRAGFVWNDRDYGTRPALASAGGLARIWFKVGATEQYYPILHSAFWAEHRLWGDDAFGYHLLNVLLHAASAILLALLLRRLFELEAHARYRGVEWIAAFIFALHPVCAESVAWIAEQKNTLSTVFYLAAALAYLRFDARRTRRPYVLATAFFLLALLTKSVTATLPAALLVVFWWRRGRLELKRDFRPLAPWLAAGAAFGLFTAWVERDVGGARGAAYQLSLVERCLVAGRALWFYLGKLIWPAHLVFIYPRWQVSEAEAWQYLFPAAAAPARARPAGRHSLLRGIAVSRPGVLQRLRVHLLLRGRPLAVPGVPGPHRAGRGGSRALARARPARGARGGSRGPGRNRRPARLPDLAGVPRLPRHPHLLSDDHRAEPGLLDGALQPRQRIARPRPGPGGDPAL